MRLTHTSDPSPVDAQKTDPRLYTAIKGTRSQRRCRY